MTHPNDMHRPSHSPDAAKNFVAPSGGGNDRIIPMPATGPMEPFDPNSSAQLAEIYKTTHVDRAKAFSIRTHQLSIITAVVTVLGAVALGAQGFLAIALMGTLGYFAVWLTAFWMDSRTSPGGVARHHSEQSWREIRRMNKARVDAFRRANDIEDQGGRWRQ